MVCIPSLARKVPTNYYLLLAFTICEAYTVGFVCATVKDGFIVLTAAVMTAAIAIALTLYAVFTKTDFTACGGIITVLGAAFLLFSLFSFLFGPTMSPSILRCLMHSLANCLQYYLHPTYFAE
jgi:FtsH-binding integral membrane protein